MLLLAGVATTVALGALHYVRADARDCGRDRRRGAVRSGRRRQPRRLVAAVVLLLAAVTCLLIYSIRRHRIDDYRGRYRIWLAASAACLVLSANSVAGLHYVLADVAEPFHRLDRAARRRRLVARAGRSAAGWIALRAFFDVKECRLAGVAAARRRVVCHVAAAASYLGFVPAMEPRIESMVAGIATLLGHWLLLAAVVSYARFVVLDAQGLVRTRPRRPQSAAPQKAKTEVAKSKPAAADSHRTFRRRLLAAETAANSTGQDAR